MSVTTVSSNEAKQHWGAMMNGVNSPDDAVIVESHGRPKVAVISYTRFEKMLELEVQARRAWALEQLRQLEERIGDRNRDLTNEQIEELADRFSCEFVDDLVAEDQVVFERDASG